MNKRRTAQQKLNLLRKWTDRGGTRQDAEYIADKNRVGVSSLYSWKKEYDQGGKLALENFSTRPHSHPNQHTAKELENIREVMQQNPYYSRNMLFSELRLKHGYSRSLDGLQHVIRMKFIGERPLSPKFEHHKRVVPPMIGTESQMDVKYVPFDCLHISIRELHKFKNQRWYMYNMIDITSREDFTYVYDSIGQAETVDFAIRAHLFFGYKFHYGRTDRGKEFTNDDTEKPSALQEFYKKIDTEYIKNPPSSPWRNCYVERNNKTWQDEFFSANLNSFCSLQDCREKMKKFLYNYNNVRIHTVLRLDDGTRHVTPTMKREECLQDAANKLRRIKQCREQALTPCKNLYKLKTA